MPLKPFEELVEENTAWLLAYVKSKIPNKSLAEDFVQEIYLKAYRAYPAYVDEGYTKAWLRRIAQNYIINYYNRSYTGNLISLDYSEDDDESSLYSLIAEESSPEEKIIENELAQRAISVINCLPEEQKQVLYLRYFADMSVEDTAKRMNLPAGTVKSKTHYALKNVRKIMGIEEKIINKKGESVMECKEAYKYLFVYAMGKLHEDKKNELEAHLEKCEICRNVAIALKNLYPQLVFARDDERSRYSIHFAELGLCYLGFTMVVNNWKEWNERLLEWNYTLPDDLIFFFSTGLNFQAEILTEFDNYGNEIECELIKRKPEDDYFRLCQKKFYRVDQCTWQHQVIFDSKFIKNINDFRSVESPDFYKTSSCNYFGEESKTAIYCALPHDASNIRIKRGNGVLDCGTYFFPYVDRYVLADEGVFLDFTFNLHCDKSR
ncbi:MAG: sigma-70 family RNA polymerase sigma factor [Eubacteriales bacterium]